MIKILHYHLLERGWWKGLVISILLVGSAYLGNHPSPRWVTLLIGGIAAVALLARPVLGLFALVVAALVIPMRISTGTQVYLNPATLLVPALLLLWLVTMLLRGRLEVAPSRVNAPLLYFVLAGGVSLLVGNALWDPAIPRPGNMLAVQLGQWAIFAFSAGAFWLTGNLVQDDVWLRRLTFTFLVLGSTLLFLRFLPVLSSITARITTRGFGGPVFCLLLTSLAGGQLLFNHTLSQGLRGVLLGLTGIVLFYAFVTMRVSASTWVAVGAVVGVLIWLRWPRLRWPIVVLLVALTASGLLFSTVWEFAGGRSEWTRTGGSRLALIRRVVDVTLRNPVTGLGPASYRPYANARPLEYRGALWINPNVNSHNNYVDLFAHVGLVGLGLFAWFVVTVAQLGLRLRQRYAEGFIAGYVNGILAAGAASLVVMLMADWILPYVYNIGFPGFQASVLVWLFMGGLVSIQHITTKDTKGTKGTKLRR
jgi:hypothetical protein